MREAIGTGETVELAREAACKQLGVESYDAEFEILELPTKKTFGLFGGSPAKVRVYIEDDPAAIAAQYVKDIVSGMGVEGVRVSVKKEEDSALLTLEGDDIGFVIGHRGETLDALQYLTGLVANHVGGSYYRVAIDIGNYREKRRMTLESLGKKMAEKSLRTGRNMQLEPMNPYERRIIHTAVQTVEGAKSWSEGEDLERHVVIGPVDGERPQRRPGGFNKNRRGPSNFGGPGGQQRRPYSGGANRPPQKPFGDRRPPRPTPSVSPAKPENPQQTDKKGSLYGRVEPNK